jgi:hypothetical protein
VASLGGMTEWATTGDSATNPFFTTVSNQPAIKPIATSLFREWLTIGQILARREPASKLWLVRQVVGGDSQGELGARISQILVITTRLSIRSAESSAPLPGQSIQHQN